LVWRRFVCHVVTKQTLLSESFGFLYEAFDYNFKKKVFLLSSPKDSMGNLPLEVGNRISNCSSSNCETISSRI
jgi:hypothetical protein